MRCCKLVKVELFFFTLRRMDALISNSSHINLDFSTNTKFIKSEYSLFNYLRRIIANLIHEANYLRYFLH